MTKKLAVFVAIILGTSTGWLRADPEPAAQATPPAAAVANELPNAAAPAPAAAPAANDIPNAAPAPLLAPPGGGCAGCGGYCHRGGSCLHRLIEWATYCPKERIGFCHSCNSCGYKGALPFYLFVGKICQEGPGLHATFPNPPCCHGGHGCKSCPAAAPCDAK